MSVERRGRGVCVERMVSGEEGMATWGCVVSVCVCVCVCVEGMVSGEGCGVYLSETEEGAIVDDL